jgi:2-furoyl-CoA dehydrogenase large subunit
VLISGEHTLPAPPDVVWRLLNDVDVLRETVPGRKELEQISVDSFTGAATVGVGVIKGLYKGSMRFVERDEPRFARVQVQARSSHAEIKGEGSVTLEPSDGGTIFRYQGEARVSGPLAAVGQRLLPSASKSQIEAFLHNVAEALKSTSK